jgi:hypothetical protein
MADLPPAGFAGFLGDLRMFLGVMFNLFYLAIGFFLWFGEFAISPLVVISAIFMSSLMSIPFLIRPVWVASLLVIFSSSNEDWEDS